MTIHGGRLIVVLVAAMISWVGLAGCGSGSPAAAPTTSAPTVTATPSPTAEADDPGCLEAGEKVTRFPAGDGTLPGVVLGTGSVGIIFGHQIDGKICQWIETARAFAAKGYRTLVFDFAGYGLARNTTSPTTTADVVAAAEHLKTLGVTKVVLIGASLGGGAVVTASVKVTLPVAAVVSLSGTGRLQTAESSVDAAAQLKAPLLCAAAKRDRGGDYATLATQMCPAKGPGPRQLLLVEGVGHGVDLYQHDPAVKAAVDAFVARYAPAG